MVDMKGADNTKPISLLDSWGKDPSGKNFERVMEELINGNSFLMLPSINKDSTKRKWVALGNEKLLLTCLFEVDGVKVLGAFTDESALSKWAKEPCGYTAMKTKDIFKLCEANNIYKIVINSDSSNIFLVHRSRKHIN